MCFDGQNYSLCHCFESHRFQLADRQAQETFLFSKTSRPALGLTSPPIEWAPGALPAGLNWLGRQADHSPPSNTDVKNEWSNTTTPVYTYMMFI